MDLLFSVNEFLTVLTTDQKPNLRLVSHIYIQYNELRWGTLVDKLKDRNLLVEDDGVHRLCFSIL